MRESIDEPSELQRAWRKERDAKIRHGRAAAQGAIIRFLKEHPGSTAEEVIRATGWGVSNCARFSTWKRDDQGIVRHYFNQAAWDKFLNHE